MGFEPRWDHRKSEIGNKSRFFNSMNAMKFYVYILQSTKTAKFYIGQTQNLENRFDEHNSGKSKYTSKDAPWNLVWYGVVGTRKESYGLEQQIKSFKSRKRIIKHIEDNQVGSGSENLQISNLLDFRESS
jgi:putative endonuclease